MKKNQKPEKEFVKYIHSLLRGNWITHSVENSVLCVKAGFPDYVYSCNGRHGFIEFKYKKQWPARADTIVRLPHFTSVQKKFLYYHGRRGDGRCFLFLQIDSDVLIFDHTRVQKIGNLITSEMIENAIFFENMEKMGRPHTTFQLLDILIDR
jgi:hypothetical protein